MATVVYPVKQGDYLGSAVIQEGGRPMVRVALAPEGNKELLAPYDGEAWAISDGSGNFAVFVRSPSQNSLTMLSPVDKVFDPSAIGMDNARPVERGSVIASTSRPFVLLSVITPGGAEMGEAFFTQKGAPPPPPPPSGGSSVPVLIGLGLAVLLVGFASGWGRRGR